MFENLTDKLERSFQILKGEGRITEINVAESLKEIRRALIDADVNYKVAKSFTDEVKTKALGQDVLKSVKPGQMMTKIVRDELAALMGGTMTDIKLEGNPAVVLIAGLQGSGKTTFSGKLANLIKSKKGRQVLLVAGDVYRPAAIEQLKVLGQQIGVEVYTEEGNKNPVQIAENAIQYARNKHINTVIVDTAGRLAVDEQMMQEITAIKAAIHPSETLFVVDSMTGQDAVNTAKEFNDRLDFDGVVLTKLDGDTRGGAAISIRAVVKKPLKFISSGEKMDALQVFHPERMADRILGMGDIVDQRPIVALLAGSRRNEIRDNLPLMAALSQKFPERQFVVAGVAWLDRALYEQYTAGSGIRYVCDQTYETLAAAEAAVVTSGTATLETALLGIPEVVVYRTVWWQVWLRPYVLKVPWVSLVNLNLGREAVAEIIQSDFSVDRAERELRAILRGGNKRERMLADFGELKTIIGGPGASERFAARMVAELHAQKIK